MAHRRRYELDAGSGEIAIADTAFHLAKKAIKPEHALERRLGSYRWRCRYRRARDLGQTDAETGLAGQVRVDGH